MRTQPVVIAGIGVRRFARVKQRAQLGVANGIIDVLARTVDAAEGLFMQQALQAVAFGHIAQGGHDDMIVIHGQVAGLVERRDLVLAGGRLIVAGAHGHAQLVQFALHFHHAGKHALRDNPKILIAELLALGRARPEQRAPGNLKIRPGKIEIVVNKKVFLLQTGIRNYRQIRMDIEQGQHPLRLAVQGLAGAQQRRFLVQRHACP